MHKIRAKFPSNCFFFKEHSKFFLEMLNICYYLFSIHKFILLNAAHFEFLQGNLTLHVKCQINLDELSEKRCLTYKSVLFDLCLQLHAYLTAGSERGYQHMHKLQPGIAVTQNRRICCTLIMNRTVRLEYSKEVVLKNSILSFSSAEY